MTVAHALCWVAFFLVPRPSAGLVNGLPVGPVESAGLLAAAWLSAGVRWSALGAGQRRAAQIVAGALAVSFAIGYACPDRGGFQARYFANSAASGDAERSTEFNGRDFTRVDRTLHFEPARAEFPLAFLNDLGRFNFYQPHEPKRELIAFSVVWDGYWLVDGDVSPRQLYLDAPGASAELLIDGSRALLVSPLDAEHTTSVSPSRGWHRVQVRFTSPYGSSRRLSVGERKGLERVPFGAPAVTTRELPSWQASAAPAARMAALAIDAAVLGWLVAQMAIVIGGLVRELVAVGDPLAAPRPQLMALLLLVAGVEALIFAMPWTWRMMTLVGGDDTLTYESYARQIQLDSFLLAQGGGEPFFYQVLYPYLLAAMHVVFGESMFGPMLVQRLLLSLVVAMVVVIAMRIRGTRAWVAALVCGAAFAFGLLADISAKLLNESFFVPLLVVWTAAMMVVASTPTRARVIGAGLLGGVTALTRSTALLGWVIAAGSCWMSWRAVPRRWVLVLTLLICSCSVMSLIAIRNWIVVHELILMPGELPVTLYGGNEPPSGVAVDEERHRAFYDRLGLHPFTRQVVEYALTAPGPFARNLANKALFALGYFDFYSPGWGYSIGLLAMSASSMTGLVLAMRNPVAPAWIALMPALIAMTQYIAVVIVYPKGMRLILPFHALMVPYAAVAADALWRRLFDGKLPRESA